MHRSCIGREQRLIRRIIEAPDLSTGGSPDNREHISREPQIDGRGDSYDSSRTAQRKRERQQAEAASRAEDAVAVAKLEAAIERVGDTDRIESGSHRPANGEMWRTPDGEVFVKDGNSDMWRSARDGGLVDSKSLGRLEAALITDHVYPAHRAPLGEVRVSVAHERFIKTGVLWQSLDDGGMIDNSSMDKIGKGVVQANPESQQ